jgi:hypothetical protein
MMAALQPTGTLTVREIEGDGDRADAYAKAIGIVTASYGRN